MTNLKKSISIDTCEYTHICLHQTMSKNYLDVYYTDVVEQIHNHRRRLSQHSMHHSTATNLYFIAQVTIFIEKISLVDF